MDLQHRWLFLRIVRGLWSTGTRFVSRSFDLLAYLIHSPLFAWTLRILDCRIRSRSANDFFWWALSSFCFVVSRSWHCLVDDIWYQTHFLGCRMQLEDIFSLTRCIDVFCMSAVSGSSMLHGTADRNNLHFSWWTGTSRICVTSCGECCPQNLFEIVQLQVTSLQTRCFIVKIAAVAGMQHSSWILLSVSICLWQTIHH